VTDILQGSNLLILIPNSPVFKALVANPVNLLTCLGEPSQYRKKYIKYFSTSVPTKLFGK
jgi:hypothetical protein